MNKRLSLSTMFLVVIASLTSSIASAKITNVDLKFATLNIEWYGIGGNINGVSKDEHRDDHLRDFLKQYVLTADVVAFEEIVDVARLEKLLPADWTCASYDHPNEKHQHVVLCTSGSYALRNVDYDNNNTIETVALDADRSRPAVRMDIVERKSNTVLVTVVAVHLKSSDKDSEHRRYQMEMIGQDLKKLPAGRAFVVMGDMNTFDTKNSNLIKIDDKYNLEKALQLSIPQAKLVAHTVKYTFRNDYHSSQFDQFLVNNLVVKSSPHVFDVCNNPQQKTRDYFDLDYYNYNVSDHCPVSLDVTVPVAF